MNDGDRVYPVNKLVMHHAVSDEMENWDDIQVQDWFSAIGKARGYQNGALVSNHEHPSRPGVMTYSMAHYCLHKYTKDGNKYGWRLTTLIKDPINNVAWHAGNWLVNQQSLGIETAGDYSGHDIDIKALMLVADEIGRPVDSELVGAGYSDGLYVYGHRDFFATACPGQIYNHIGDLIDMINNPAKWNNQLFPVPPEVPPTPPSVTWKSDGFPKSLYANTDLNVINLDNNQAQGGVIKKGTKIDFADYKPQNNTTYYRSAYSASKGFNWGIDVNSLTADNPIPPVVVPPTEPPVVTPPAPSKDDQQDARLSVLEKAVKALQDTLTVIIEFFKNLKIGK